MKHDIVTYTWLSPLVRLMKKRDEVFTKDLQPLPDKFLPGTNAAVIDKIFKLRKQTAIQKGKKEPGILGGIIKAYSSSFWVFAATIPI